MCSRHQNNRNLTPQRLKFSEFSNLFHPPLCAPAINWVSVYTIPLSSTPLQIHSYDRHSEWSDCCCTAPLIRARWCTVRDWWELQVRSSSWMGLCPMLIAFLLLQFYLQDLLVFWCFFFNTTRKFSISVHVLLSTFPPKKPPKNQPKPNVVREMESST